MTPSRQRVWAAFALGSLCFGYAFVQRVAPSVMTGELMRDLSVGGAALGTLSAMYFYTYALIQFPVGMLLDRFGPRTILSVAMFVCAGASLAFASSDTLFSAAASRALIGAAVAFCFVGSLTVISVWLPPERFGTLSGAVQSAGMLGAMLGQAPLRVLVDSVGWREAFVWLAALAATLALLLYCVIPRRPAVTAPSSEATQTQGNARDVLRNWHTWRCALIGFTLTPIMLAFAGLWSVPWMVQVHGYSEAVAAATASLMFLGWAIGSVAAGSLSDALGRRRPVILWGATLCALGFATLISLPSPSHLVMNALFLLTGLGGSTMVLTFALVRDGNPGAHASAAMGMVNTCVVGSGAVMQPLIGWLLEWQWDGQSVNGVPVFDAANYRMAFSTLLGLLGIAWLASWTLRERA